MRHTTRAASAERSEARPNAGQAERSSAPDGGGSTPPSGAGIGQADCKALVDGVHCEKVRPSTERQIFEGLDDIPWADLDHAYGAATDLPGLRFERFTDASLMEKYVILQCRAWDELRTARQLPDHLALPIGALIHRQDELTAFAETGAWPWDDMFLAERTLLASRFSDEGFEAISGPVAWLFAGAKWMIFDYGPILSLILGRPAPRIRDDPCTLSPGRQRIARAFLVEPAKPDWMWFWSGRNGNASGDCKRLGVPHDRTVWLKWLGLPPEQRGIVGWVRRILN
jgi:hypothetical protein